MISSRVVRISLLWAIGCWLCGLTACQVQPKQSAVNTTNNTTTAKSAGTNYQGEKIEKTAEEWRKQLSPMQYQVLREKGTERAFSNPEMLNNKAQGNYCCAACQLPLFRSSTKFNSGTGWPSFYDVYDPSHVGKVADNSHGMERVEVVCNRCGGHLGHVFDDGPAPTGLRYCINGVSLQFKASKD